MLINVGDAALSVPQITATFVIFWRDAEDCVPYILTLFTLFNTCEYYSPAEFGDFDKRIIPIIDFIIEKGKIDIDEKNNTYTNVNCNGRALFLFYER